MENNYYTPSIEEFHVGFEFEVNCDNDWIKESLYSNEQVNVLPFMNTNNIRVKYLDKEDIESLGWTDGETHGLSGYVLNYATDDSYQMYYDKDNQFTQIYNWDSKIIFEGIIKNKSELKRLLKQLEINGQD
jgi:hypothetical protein